VSSATTDAASTSSSLTSTVVHQSLTIAPAGIPHVNVLVPHFDRPVFLKDMLYRLRRTNDSSFSVMVFDFDSAKLRTQDDVDTLLKEAGFIGDASARVHFARVKQIFSKSLGLHMAFQTVPPSTPTVPQIVTVLDVDVLVNASYFDLIRTNVEPGKTAVVFSILRDSHGRQLELDNYSTGMIAFAREDGLAAGGMASARYFNRTLWGDEDDDLYQRLRKIVKVNRVVNRGMLHRRHERSPRDPWYRTYFGGHT